MKSTVPGEAGDHVTRVEASTAPDNRVGVERNENSLTSGAPVNSDVAGASIPTVRRVRRRRATFTDGPFAETKEMLASQLPPNAARR
ncbi:MAG TPA: hypothetical protein VK636_07460 [Gemmatimonadaceae bacterium]|nr:hypothetical protein [Gemmatimonadaceae bacterium]